MRAPMAISEARFFADRYTRQWWTGIEVNGDYDIKYDYKMREIIREELAMT